MCIGVRDALEFPIGLRGRFRDPVVLRLARQDPEEQNASVGPLVAEQFHEGRDSPGHRAGRHACGAAFQVVGARHQDHDLRFASLHLAVGESPQHELGLVTRDAHIGGVERGVLLVPDLFADGTPSRGDAVADKEDVDASLGRHVCEVAMLYQVTVIPPGHRRCGVLEVIGFCRLLRDDQAARNTEEYRENCRREECRISFCCHRREDDRRGAGRQAARVWTSTGPFMV